MVLIKKNLSNEKNLVVDNLTVNNTMDGLFNIAPSNIQTSPPGVLTVNEISKLIGRTGDLLDTNSNQTINSVKTFSSEIKMNGSVPISLRSDSLPNAIIHALQYYHDVPANSFDILLQTSDENNVDVGVNIGFHQNNLLANPTVSKFNVRHRNTVNSTKVNIEDINFLKMNSTTDNRFQLTSLDCISIGSTSTSNGSIFINKISNAEINVNSSSNIAKLGLTGATSQIDLGANFKITTNTTNPEDFKILRSPTVSWLTYNNISGCTSIGDNLGSSGMNYCLLNLGETNKIVKVPSMNTSQQNAFIGSLSGTTYSGSLFFNSQSNTLCYVDSNNVLHKLAGSITASDYNYSVDLDSNQVITGDKTFSKSSNNSSNILIDNPIGVSNFISYTNQFSPNSLRIGKSNDDLAIQIGGIERMRLDNSTSSLDLNNGGVYKKNGVDIKDVSETLTNKTIAFANNTLTNVCSLNTSQTISSQKILSAHTPLLLTNLTESIIRYSGISVYDQIFDSSGVNFYDNSNSKSIMKLEPNGVVKVGGNLVFTGKYNSTTTSPTVNSDSSQGYSVDSLWRNTVAKSTFRCIDNSIGAARWFNMNRREISHQTVVSTTLNTQTPYVYVMAGDYYYNTAEFIFSTDGTMQIEVFNLSTSTQIAITGNIGPGVNYHSLSLGTALSYTFNQTLIFSFYLRSGTYASVLSTATL